MTKARTYSNFGVGGINGLFFSIILTFLTVGTMNLTAQCNIQLLYNGIDVTGQTSFQYTLAPGECATTATFELVVSGGVPPACTPSRTSVTFPDNSGLFFSSVTRVTTSFPVGATTISFAYLNFLPTQIIYPTITLTINPYPNPITSLACNDDIQISLNQNCSATITADMMLEGGPYKCYDLYVVVVRDARGNLIDRDPATPGVQLDGNDFGNCYQTTVIDTATGNSCWGRLCVEDKLPPQLDCSIRPFIVDCGADVSPDALGYPNVYEPCGPYTLTYVDIVEKLGCDDQLGLERIIHRTWTAIDQSGNIGTCTQDIWVQLGDLDAVDIPESFDDIEQPALECDEKIDLNKDITPHIVNFPLCVDGYLLDSAHWVSTGGTPFGGDLSGERQPKVLGWNCIPTGPYQGHPSPGGIYYEPHPAWSFGGCWGDNEMIKWAGTGFPTGADCSNINYTFSDIKIDIADPNCNAGAVGCYKILRKWTLLNWCDGEILEEYQVIKVLDKDGPTITYPDEITVGMVSYECSGIWNVAPPWITDNCSEEIHYDLRVTGGTVLGNENNGYTVIGLSEGVYTGYITAYDCCGQSTTHEIEITVIDNVPPVAICDDRTIISLNGNPATGTDNTKLCAESLDNGSYDNCNGVYFKVIRMDALLGTVNGSYADNTIACEGADADDDALRAGGQVYFDDCAFFCCEDLDTVIMVVLRVFDLDPGAGPIVPFMMEPGGYLEGHFTDCMVEVEVQDKSNPLVVAPPDLVIPCMFWFDDSEDALSDPDSDLFGRVVTSVNDRRKVTTRSKVCEQFCYRNPKTGYYPSNVQNGLACDFYNNLYNPAHPDDQYELTWGFDGYVISTCGTDFDIRIIDERECGQGRIIREVVVRRGNTYFRDRQSIWIIDCDPFYVSEDCFDFDDDIRWPLDCRQPDIIEGCSNANTSPDNPLLGRPEIVNGADDNCALIAIDYSDEVFTVEPDACYKILRTWRVIDWCLYDPLNSGSDGRWEFIQIIKVLDKDKPVVTCVIGPCEPAVKDSASQQCFGHVVLTADVDDECTPDNWLNYEYKLDLYNDGIIDAYSGPGKPGTAAFNYDNPYADDAKDASDASGRYPIGVHRITWFIEDGCGNVGICDSVFRIKDCKRPTPYCKTGIITVVMPSSGSITVWANDLDAGSFDNCTEPQDLKFYFNGDNKWTGFVVNCDTFLNRGATGKVRIEVDMYVEDEEGNFDFCRTIIEVQDPNGICGTVSGIASVAGIIHNENSEFVDEVEVDLMSNNILSDQRITSTDGYFAFIDITKYEDYEVSPFKDGDYLNGVSTKDLVTIQRHLLGLKEITSPYQLIAADANNSQEISASDISTLRKLILGLDSELSEVNSWRFVPTSHSFEDLANPWYPVAFPEQISYSKLDRQMMSSDFTAVKVGDVTGDAVVGVTGSNKTRSDEVITFEIEENVYFAGEQVTIPVSISESQMLSGYQFTMVYDENSLVLEDILIAQNKMNASNFALISEGTITVSWNDHSGMNIVDNVYTLVFSAKADGQVGNALQFNSSVTTAEAYDQDLNTSSVELNVKGKVKVVDEEFELYQNVPNPFGSETVIGFDLPTEMKVLMTIYDVMGKVVRIIEVDGNHGYNEVSVSKTDLNATGILYYQLDAGEHTSTKKMILMK